MNNLRLLIVDDEEAARYGIRRALESPGLDIAEAESAESARALMGEKPFDLLLLDVQEKGRLISDTMLERVKLAGGSLLRGAFSTERGDR